MLMPRCLPFALLFWLAGCASNPQACDPANRDAGLLDKAGCVYGGHYEQRVQERQAVLLDEQKANQLFRTTYETLQQESSRVATDMASARASLARMSASLGALLQEIKAKAADNRQVGQQVQALEARLQQIQAERDAAEAAGIPLSPLQQRQQVAELQVQVQDLQQALGLR